MEREELRILLEKVESGQQTAADALSDISLQPDMLVGNYADIDLHRHMRQGMPEVIYGAGKTAEQIVEPEETEEENLFSAEENLNSGTYETEGIAKYSDHPFIRREGGRDCQSTGIFLLFDAADRYRQ